MNYVLTENAVRKIKRAITPRLGDGLAPTGGPATISPDTYPAPFTVRWAASLASPESSEGAGDATDGEWIIYLPTTGLLKVGAADVNITSALTAAGSPYPAGWFKLLDAQDAPILSRTTGGTLYLVINGATAEFDDQPGSVGGTNSVKIATASVDSTTGARTVKQFVCSSLVIGAGSELLFWYNPDTHQISAGAVCYGIQICLVAAYTVSQAGFYYVRVFRGPIATATRAEIVRQNYNTLISYSVSDGEADVVYVPLYQIDENLNVTKDWRFMPHVQAWEDSV